MGSKTKQIELTFTIDGRNVEAVIDCECAAGESLRFTAATVTKAWEITPDGGYLCLGQTKARIQDLCDSHPLTQIRIEEKLKESRNSLASGTGID
jgi:hypothetical protein